MESTAKLFRNGRSQAVRLPKKFRMKGTEVKIRKEGQKVILEPLTRKKWPRGFWDIFTPDQDFEAPEALPDISMPSECRITAGRTSVFA